MVRFAVASGLAFAVSLRGQRACHEGDDGSADQQVLHLGISLKPKTGSAPGRFPESREPRGGLPIRLTAERRPATWQMT